VAGKRSYNTYTKTRLALFVRSYVGYSISSHLRAKYKIDNSVAKSSLLHNYSNKKSISEISRLSKILNLNYKPLWRFILIGKLLKISVKISPQKEIRAYLKIEKELIILKTARQEKENVVNDDYESRFLGVAIERAAGNNLGNIKDDSVFEERLEILQKEYLHWYYKIAYKYKLPTARILAFIMRLISK